MSPEEIEKLRELRDERERLQARIDSMVRDDAWIAYAAQALPGGAAIFVTRLAMIGDLSWVAAVVILVIIGAIAAVAFWGIRAYGLYTVLNWTMPWAHWVDDPAQDLRDKRDAVEERIEALYAANRPPER